MAKPHLDSYRFESERIVAFLDILGFKNLVKHWLENRTLAATVENALRKSLEWVGGRSALGFRCRQDWHVRIFSDCICMSQPASDLGFLEITEGVACFQREMIAAGFPVRGGISIGRHFESDIALLSPALIEAYELESDAAVYPRVLFSESALKQIDAINDDEIRQEIKEYITVDEDDRKFVCYMLFEEDDPWLKGHRFYSAHKSVVESALTNPTSVEAIREKYAWMGQFHNWCIRSTAEVLKRRGETAEDEVWSFNMMLTQNVTETRKFGSLLWTDRAFQMEAPPAATGKKIDWIKEWPGAQSDDDEEEPDAEVENYI